MGVVRPRLRLPSIKPLPHYSTHHGSKIEALASLALAKTEFCIRHGSLDFDVVHRPVQARIFCRDRQNPQYKVRLDADAGSDSCEVGVPRIACHNMRSASVILLRNDLALLVVSSLMRRLMVNLTTPILTFPLQGGRDLQRVFSTQVRNISKEF